MFSRVSLLSQGVLSRPCQPQLPWQLSCISCSANSKGRLFSAHSGVTHFWVFGAFYPLETWKMFLFWNQVSPQSSHSDGAKHPFPLLQSHPVNIYVSSMCLPHWTIHSLKTAIGFLFPYVVPTTASNVWIQSIVFVDQTKQKKEGKRTKSLIFHSGGCAQWTVQSGGCQPLTPS